MSWAGEGGGEVWRDRGGEGGDERNRMREMLKR